MTTRTLTLFCEAGLANRLRVLVSGIAVAEACERRLRVWWPRTEACAASFGELFVGDWPVTDVDSLPDDLAAHKAYRWQPGALEGLVADPRPDIVLGLNNWVADARSRRAPALHRRCAELLDALEPLPEIRRRIETLRADRFRPTMIGAHLRRGDFVRKRPDVAANTRPALVAVDRFLAVDPDAGIFLCTDDGAVHPRTGQAVRREGVHDIFRARYGERVVSSTPRTLDRRTVESIEDAVVDLWLLRSTAMVVSTVGSSFSHLAAFGRPVPVIRVGQGTPSYRILEALARVTGVRWLIGRAMYARLGYRGNFPQAWATVVGRPARRLRRWRQRAPRC